MTNPCESNFSLNYHQVPVGKYYLPPDYPGRELNCIPLKELEIENDAFAWLKRKLHETRYNFKVHDNGQVQVSIPRGHKYGYILGWIAWTYRQTINLEESY